MEELINNIKNSKYSISELSRISNVSRQTIYDILNGKEPRRYIKNRLIKALEG